MMDPQEVADTQTKWTAVVNSLLRQDYPSAQSAYNQIVRASQVLFYFIFSVSVL